MSSKTTEIFWSGLINWTPRLLNQLNWKRESAHTMVLASSMHKIILKNNFTEFLRKNKRFRARHLNGLLFTRWIYIIRWLALSRIKLVDVYIWELQHWGKGNLKIKRRGKEVVLKQLHAFCVQKAGVCRRWLRTRYVWEKNHDWVEKNQYTQNPKTPKPQNPMYSILISAFNLSSQLELKRWRCGQSCC